MSARLAFGLCLALTLALTETGSAVALSGYGSDQAPVNAQYPDATTDAGPGGPSGTSLGSLMHARPRAGRDGRRAPVRPREIRRIQRQVARSAAAALASAPGLGTSESGSLAILLGGAGVLTIGGVLRWQRRPGQP